MTVATGIETGAVGHSGPGQGLFQAKGLGKALGGISAGAAQATSSSTAGGPGQSFVPTGKLNLHLWVTASKVLAVLDGLKAEPDGANEIEDAAEAPIHEPGPGTSSSAVAVSPWLALPLKTGMPQAAGLVVLPSSTRIADIAPWLSVQAPKQSAAQGTESSATPSKPTQSSTDVSGHSTHKSEFGKSAWGAVPPCRSLKQLWVNCRCGDLNRANLAQESHSVADGASPGTSLLHAVSRIFRERLKQ